MKERMAKLGIVTLLTASTTFSPGLMTTVSADETDDIEEQSVQTQQESEETESQLNEPAEPESTEEATGEQGQEASPELETYSPESHLEPVEPEKNDAEAAKEEAINDRQNHDDEGEAEGTSPVNDFLPGNETENQEESSEENDEEASSEEQTSEESTEETAGGESTEQPALEGPSSEEHQEEPSLETPTDDTSEEEPNEEQTGEPAVDEPENEEPKEENTGETSGEESTEQTPTVENPKGESSSEPSTEELSEENTSEQTKEETVEMPQEESTEEAAGSAADDGKEASVGEKQGKREIYRYDYDVLEDINLTPGGSEEQLKLLDKRVNRLMTSKIVDVEDMSEEEIMEIEEEVKKEEGITQRSDREELPNTGENNQYTYIYAAVLLLAGILLYFLTRKPRNE